eukprot:gene21983-29044_t
MAWQRSGPGVAECAILIILGIVLGRMETRQRLDLVPTAIPVRPKTHHLPSGIQASWAGSGTNNPVDVMSPFTQASMTSLPTSDGGFSRQGSVLVPAGSNMVQGPDASLLQGTAASLQPASSNMAQGASTIQHRAGSNMLQGTAYLLQPASSNMAQGAAAILQPAGSNMAQGTAASTLSAISSVQAPSMSGLVQSQSRALQPAGSNMAQGPSEPMKNLVQTSLV